MTRLPYDIRVSGDPIQEITSVGELSRHYVRKRSEDFSDTKLRTKLSSLGASVLVVAPPELSRIAVDQGDNDAVLLSVPELEFTRHESRTAVRFGQLVIERAEKEALAELVAIKYTTPALAAREFAATNAIRDRISDDYAYEPIGFISDEQARTIGYISRYRHEVTTLDRVLWNQEATSRQRLAAAGRAGIWLATLHNHGLAHGDAEAKNIAHDSADVPLYPDLETMYELGSSHDEGHRGQYSDISDFIRYQDTKLSGDEFEHFLASYCDTHESRTIAAAQIRDIYDQPLRPVAHFS